MIPDTDPANTYSNRFLSSRSSTNVAHRNQPHRSQAPNPRIQWRLIDDLLQRRSRLSRESEINHWRQSAYCIHESRDDSTEVCTICLVHVDLRRCSSCAVYDIRPRAGYAGSKYEHEHGNLLKSISHSLHAIDRALRWLGCSCVYPQCKLQTFSYKRCMNTTSLCRNDASRGLIGVNLVSLGLPYDHEDK